MSGIHARAALVLKNPPRVCLAVQSPGLRSTKEKRQNSRQVSSVCTCERSFRVATVRGRILGRVNHFFLFLNPPSLSLSLTYSHMYIHRHLSYSFLYSASPGLSLWWGNRPASRDPIPLPLAPAICLVWPCVKTLNTGRVARLFRKKVSRNQTGADTTYK